MLPAAFPFAPLADRDFPVFFPRPVLFSLSTRLSKSLRLMVLVVYPEPQGPFFLDAWRRPFFLSCHFLYILLLSGIPARCPLSSSLTLVFTHISSAISVKSLGASLAGG